MKTFFLLLITVLFAVPVYSNGDGTWVAQTSGTTNFLRGVSFTDANTGTVVGDGGTILRTTNGGNSWTSQTSGTTAQLNAVSFTDANNGTAVGAWWNGFGIILRTTNGGTNWTLQSSGEPFDLYGVCFIDANIGTVVGSGGRILRTINGGTTWTSQTSVTHQLNSVSFTDANNGTAVGAYGTILITTNGGTNWTYQFTGEDQYLTGVSFIDANTGTAVGFDNGGAVGLILKTTDGGTTWTSQWTSQSTGFIMRGVSFSDANNGTAVAEGGVILRTTNGGTNWNSQSSGTSVWLNGVSFTDANIGTAVGYNGTILRYKPNPNYGNNLQSGDNLYYFANSTTGATNAPSQPVFDWRDTTGSTDLILNGMSISPIGAGNIDNGQYGFSLPTGYSISFFGVNYNVVTVGTNGIVGFTAFDPTNTGSVSSTGLPQNVFTGPAIFPLWMDLDYGDADVPINRLSYKVTSSEVIITYDRAPLSGADANDYVSFQVVISHSISPTQNSKIIVQFDDAAFGSSFINKYNTNTLPPHISGLQGSNSTSQILQYRYMSSTMLVTEGPLFGSPLAVAFGPDNDALPVDLISFSAIVNNNDVTLSWTTAWEENNAKFDVQRKIAETEAWITLGSVTGNGTMYEERNYSYTDKNLVTGKYEYRLVQIDYDGNSTADFDLNQIVEIEIPARFELSQNYPNPFNPSTKINFQLPVDNFVTLKVYDLTGREVVSLVNENLTAGYYTYEFNGINLSSGVYFYRLVTSSSVLTKKMLLIK